MGYAPPTTGVDVPRVNLRVLPGHAATFKITWDPIQSLPVSALTVEVGPSSAPVVFPTAKFGADVEWSFTAAQTASLIGKRWVMLDVDDKPLLAGTVVGWAGAVAPPVGQAVVRTVAGLTTVVLVGGGGGGLPGSAGTAATIAIGTVTTLAAGATATVTNVGTATNAILDIGLPQGLAGTGGSGAGLTQAQVDERVTIVATPIAQAYSGAAALDEGTLADPSSPPRQALRGTTAEWATTASQALVLADGQIGFVKGATAEAHELIVGDGVTAVSDLSRFITRLAVQTLAVAQGTPTQAQVNTAVNEYFANNPVGGAGGEF